MFELTSSSAFLNSSNFKFDIKNNIALYLTDHDTNSSIIYIPDTHKCIIRADIFKIHISELTYLTWFKKRSDLIHNKTSPFTTNKHAIINFFENSIIDTISPQTDYDNIISSIPSQIINQSSNSEITSNTQLPFLNHQSIPSTNNIEELTNKISKTLTNFNSKKKNSIISGPVFTDHKLSKNQLLSNNAQYTCLAAQIQTDKNSISDTVSTDHEISKHQPLSNNAQYTCLAAQIQTDENSISDTVSNDHKISKQHQLLSNNAQYTCLAAQIQTNENSIISGPVFTDHEISKNQL
jgi:hypothetical protein